mmetsp:Transcript_11528/g.38963  ORF Transcript_11528/g.38963 Transcript_11528/m.38963 type:complete len:292 (-) Transcript_11528:769-1644(-)
MALERNPQPLLRQLAAAEVGLQVGLIHAHEPPGNPVVQPVVLLVRDVHGSFVVARARALGDQSHAGEDDGHADAREEHGAQHHNEHGRLQEVRVHLEDLGPADAAAYHPAQPQHEALHPSELERLRGRGEKARKGEDHEETHEDHHPQGVEGKSHREGLGGERPYADANVGEAKGLRDVGEHHHGDLGPHLGLAAEAVPRVVGHCNAREEERKDAREVARFGQAVGEVPGHEDQGSLVHALLLHAGDGLEQAGIAQPAHHTHGSARHDLEEHLEGQQGRAEGVGALVQRVE